MDDAARALLARASALFRAGRDAEALPAYEALLARAPDLPDSWFNLAMLQRRARRPDAALASYARALALGIAGPEEVHLQRGVIFADDLGDGDAARTELEAALRLAPAYVPALINLGNLHEDFGDRDAARDAYRRVLAAHPGEPLALARLSAVSDLAGAADPLLDRIRAALSVPGATALDRADLGFALGAALDRVGAYDDAFAAYAAANAASRELLAAAGVRYDRAAQESLVDRLITTVPARVSRPAGSAAAAPPIFICGMFRSGSTLAEAILARHSAVVGGGELGALPALVAARLQPYPERLAAATPAELAALRDAYLAEVAPRHPPGMRLTDKRPDNFLHIGLIKTLFPDARIVHTVRNAPDNWLSVYFLHGGADLAYATALDDIRHYDGEHQRLMAHWRAVWPDDILDLDYDRLVADPAAEVARLAVFCGLAFEPGMLGQGGEPRAVRTASNWQVRQALYRASSGRWRNYRRHLDSDAPGV